MASQRTRLFQRGKNATPLDVLVVEDDPIFRTLVETWLDQSTYRIEVADHLDAAAERLRDTAFDLILLDLNLPDTRGLDTLDSVQAVAGETPVVVLTGNDEEDLGLEALRHGAQDFYEKAGIDPEVLRRDLQFAVERKRVEKARRRNELLEQQKKRLEELDAAKGRFYHAAAEGIANPLRPLLFQVQVLRMEMPDDAKPGLREALAALESASGDMDRRLKDLLDVTAIQAGALASDRALLDLVPVVRGVVDRFETEARRNRLALDALLPPAVPVLGDAGRLAQVVTHLLHNAIKFTPGGGRVVVQADQDEGWVELSVEDDGVGMDASALDRAFERFLDRPPSGDVDRGLGLAFCKAVVEDHGGGVAIHSPGPDEGTTVTVRLPLADS